MQRVQITVSEGPAAAILHITVRITDINYGNHLGNDSVVSIIHEARMQFLRQHGLSELDIGGAGLIMTDLAVKYLNESFYGDQLQVEVFVADVTRVTFQLIYKLTTRRSEQEVVVATAATTLVCYDYDRKKVVSMPEALADVLR